MLLQLELATLVSLLAFFFIWATWTEIAWRATRGHRSWTSWPTWKQPVRRLTMPSSRCGLEGKPWIQGRTVAVLAPGWLILAPPVRTLAFVIIYVFCVPGRNLQTVPRKHILHYKVTTFRARRPKKSKLSRSLAASPSWWDSHGRLGV